MGSKIILGAFVQTRPKFGQNEENIEEAIRLASRVKADIYVFPELCNTGYAFTSKRECHSLAESLRNGSSAEKFQAFTEKKRCTAVAGLAEKDGEKTYNSSIVVERGAILGTYRKMHLFFREKLWFSKSNSGFNTFLLESLGCKIGVLICFDWLFPEASRKLAMDDAEIICHPSDLVLPGKAQVGMMARAFENRIFAVTANRVGSENRGPKDRFRFTGKSQVISPQMEILAKANATEVVAKIARMDLRLARTKRVTTLNDLREDMRTDYY
jgi:predicted amidohydrolase